MVLISFPHPQPISCPYSKNTQYPTQAWNAEPQHRSTDVAALHWHPMHAHGRKSLLLQSACKSKLAPYERGQHEVLVHPITTPTCKLSPFTLQQQVSKSVPGIPKGP